MFKLSLSLFIFLSLSAKAETLALFHFERSKNINQVHYELRINPDCSPLAKDPVHGYWKDLVEGPNVTSEIGVFESMAYGISDQKVEGEWVHFKMKALETKKFKAHIYKNGKCIAEAWTDIAGKPSILKKAYIFAVEGLVKPTVKYIDLFGVGADGKPTQERMEF